jgi:predicted DNA-binding ArsR family transcriptional regulator
MKRIKVINEPTELVPMLRALDTQAKRDVFNAVSQDWCTLKDIEERFGKEGRAALEFFEKMKLVETMWQTTEGNTQEKAYHTYYMSFHINTSCPIQEISEILSIAVMPPDEFKKLEDSIIKMIGDGGMFAGDISEQKELSMTMLKSLVKRSVRLEYRGHRIEITKEEEK